ncbi:carbohydrate ABC transporter permease [Halostella salina]|uniref:carbohydrate ABC transporter permease n=1 Tax=Halostella salina TaxID=1547897 RepID=UPI000EF770D5|nr:carbohydrate ABC transporter permease [Halostella salina]
MSTATEPDDDEARGPLQRWVRDAIQNPQKVYRALFYSATGFFLVTTLFPFYWLLVLALTPRELMTQFSFPPTPNGFNPESFITVFQQEPFHLYVFNSFVLAIVTTVIVIFIASLAGYVFGRLEFPGRGPLMLGILAISYFPPAAFVVPLFRVFTGRTPVEIPFVDLVLFQPPRLLNTPGSMILPFSALFMPLSIFILTTFYAQIPDGLEDAARVEGTTRIGALFRVIMPLSAPGVATAAVLTFISVYNEYFFSSIMALSNEPSQWSPLVGGILSYQTQYATAYDLMAAASIIGVLPVVILVVIAQERIVSGLTAGALKE